MYGAYNVKIPNTQHARSVYSFMDMKLKLLSTEILCLGISLRQAFCLFLSFFLFCSFLPSITEFLVKKCCSPVPNAQSLVSGFFSTSPTEPGGIMFLINGRSRRYRRTRWPCGLRRRPAAVGLLGIAGSNSAASTDVLVCG